MKIDLPALARRAGRYRRDKFVAPEIEPTRAQRDDVLRIYMRVVREWQRQWMQEIRPFYESTLGEPGFRDSVNEVEGAVDSAEAALNRLVVSLGADLSGWVVDVEQWHRGRFGQLFTPVGVRLDMLLGPGDVGPTLQGVLADNASLIRSLNDQMRNGISGHVFRGLTNRTPAREVAREIRKTANIGRRRAELIASDQLSKLTGRLDQARQEQVGLVAFQWAHSGKRHPRPEHVARDGEVYRWDSAVGKNDPPGRAIYCGCRSRAVLDLDDAVEPTGTVPPPPPPTPVPVPLPPRRPSVARPRRVVPPPPDPTPTAALGPAATSGGFRSPINPAVTNQTLRVEKRLQVQKQLSARLATPAADPRYASDARYRGRNPRDYGKASFSTAWNDDAATAVAAIMPELDSLADQIGIARLRGIKTTAGRQNADMGGGVMALSPAEFNARLAASRAGGATELAKAAQDEAAEILAQQRALRPRLDELRDDIFAAREARDPVRVAELIQTRNGLVKEFERLNRKRVNLGGTAVRANRAESAERTAWRPGDDPKNRPWSVALYHEAGIDRIRSTMFHEFAHHVHQQLKREGAYTRPLEIRLRTLWAERRTDKAFRDRQASEYSLANQHEWFAENFSLFVMGKPDLVDPALRELIEDIFNGRF